jgi:hypothetical protein
MATPKTPHEIKPNYRQILDLFIQKILKKPKWGFAELAKTNIFPAIVTGTSGCSKFF